MKIKITPSTAIIIILAVWGLAADICIPLVAKKIIDIEHSSAILQVFFWLGLLPGFLLIMIIGFYLVGTLSRIFNGEFDDHYFTITLPIGNKTNKKDQLLSELGKACVLNDIKEQERLLEELDKLES